MQEYNHLEVEKKWQAHWEEKEPFKAFNDSEKEKFYVLIEFPYPSGQGLHVGHPRSYTALDIVARKKRMQGLNVLYPMGWDAFGLPTENYAIKTGVHPAEITRQNIANFKRQIKSLGISYDWSREINTTDPEYYKWTQWIFKKMFEKGLAYKASMPINWCSACKVGLSNEEVIAGSCERCGGPVIHKEKSQWMLRITAYADRLIDDLSLVEYPERVKNQQIHWIGRSHGMLIDFSVADTQLQVFTTRPDTIFGSTYLVISPEHPLLQTHQQQIENLEQVRAYQAQAALKSEFERGELNQEKSGVQLQGLYAEHPFTGQQLPIFISDYVLMTYGTGAIMAVPAHDQRDYDFAVKFNLPIVEVVQGADITQKAYTQTQEGVLVQSDFLNGLPVEEAQRKVGERLKEMGIGQEKVNYKLRDWVFSRQRYWGEPIPLVHCAQCGWVALPDDQLPLCLPDLESFEPGEDGQSPLSKLESFVHTTCPTCQGPAVRETDTMPQWAGSSWYFMRYADPDNANALASKEALAYWLPVDWYNGGMEHTTLHLLYSRFWYKFLYDIGIAPGPEPYKKRTSHGMILGENNEKMSKSRGNVINPDELILQYGADTLRLYEMFIGDYEKPVPWSSQAIKGCRRFLERVWKMQEIVRLEDAVGEAVESSLHRAIAKVSHDYDHLKFNTAIATLMALTNEFYEQKAVSLKHYQIFLQLLNPAAPHLTEEIWQRVGCKGYIYDTAWPIHDPEKLQEDVIEMPVQINGKVKGKIFISKQAKQEDIVAMASAEPAIEALLRERSIKKVIFVPGKILNIVL